VVSNSPEAARYIKPILGSSEFINGKERYCLWVEPEEFVKASTIPELEARFKRVAAMRSNSRKVATQKLSRVPYRFGEVRFRPTDSIIVPRVSSENRPYIPMG